MKKLAFLILTLFWLSLGSALADSGHQYQLYKNHEKFGIVVFPKQIQYDELDRYIRSIGFEPADSGKAVMRSGSKNENETYMMPLDVQKKHSMDKFIVIQVLESKDLLVGVFHPEWGLTLPSSLFQLEEVKKNIPRTLNIFRGANPQKETRWHSLPHGIPETAGNGFPNTSILMSGGDNSHARL